MLVYCGGYSWSRHKCVKLSNFMMQIKVNKLYKTWKNQNFGLASLDCYNIFTLKFVQEQTS